MDFFWYILRNGENIELIDKFISSELEINSQYKFESLLVLFIIMFNELKHYIKKSGISSEEESNFINRILEKFSENNLKSTIVN